MRNSDRTIQKITGYVEALRRIAALPKSHEGRKDEEEFNDLEDAFSGGCEAGEY